MLKEILMETKTFDINPPFNHHKSLNIDGERFSDMTNVELIIYSSKLHTLNHPTSH